MQRREVKDKTVLEILTDQLVEHASILLEKRFEFLELLRGWATPIHRQISRQLEELEIKYIPTVHVSEGANKGKIEKIYLEMFYEIQQNEIDRGTTLVGPHRDDLAFRSEEHTSELQSRGN